MGALAIAKTDRFHPNPCGLRRSLIGHGLDAAYVADRVLENETIRRTFKRITGIRLCPAIKARLAVLVGFHDFGKANYHFWLRIQGRKLNGQYVKAGHLAEALVAWKDLAIQTTLDNFQFWFDNEDAFVEDILPAILGHHGSPIDEAQCSALDVEALWYSHEDYNPATEVRLLYEALSKRFLAHYTTAPKIPHSARLTHFIAGLTQFCDAIASSLPISGSEDRSTDIDALLHSVSWKLKRGDFDDFPLANLRPMQEVMATLQPEPVVFLEAPTGEGKTEAALIYATKLMKEDRVDGLFFAAPTRAAASKLHERVSDIMSKVHPDIAGRCARLIPGEFGLDKGDVETPGSWMTSFPVNMLAMPVVVGTIDQAMNASLLNKYAAKREFLLNRMLLIIDEVHASDAYMTRIICNMLKKHVASGGYSLLMSATLGDDLKQEIIGAVDPKRNSVYTTPYADAIRIPYPLISTISGQNLPVKANREKHSRVGIVQPYDALQKAVEAVENGSVVLWIRSTVTDAVEDYQRLKSHLGDNKVMLHHSRFVATDRLFLDDRVEAIIGKKGTRDSMVIVSTQTCEQSLDIDADILVTDACPADVMLQRMGRVGRFRENYVGPVYAIDPLCDGKTWDDYASYAGKSISQDQLWAFVYNALVVRSTFQWLRDNEVNGETLVIVPDHSRQWVEHATHIEKLKDISFQAGQKWENVIQTMMRDNGVAGRAATTGLIDHERVFHKNTINERISTRFSNPDIDIPLPDDGIRSRFTIDRVQVLPVPSKYLKGFDSSRPDDITATIIDETTDRSIVQISAGTASVTLEYSDVGLHVV